jgi:hypothetical protein
MSEAGHYEVTMGERDRATALGAQQITPGEADTMARQRTACS